MTKKNGIWQKKKQFGRSRGNMRFLQRHQYFIVSTYLWNCLSVLRRVKPKKIKKEKERERREGGGRREVKKSFGEELKYLVWKFSAPNFCCRPQLNYPQPLSCPVALSIFHASLSNVPYQLKFWTSSLNFELGQFIVFFSMTRRVVIMLRIYLYIVKTAWRTFIY